LDRARDAPPRPDGGGCRDRDAGAGGARPETAYGRWSLAPVPEGERDLAGLPGGLRGERRRREQPDRSDRAGRRGRKGRTGAEDRPRGSRGAIEDHLAQYPEGHTLRGAGKRTRSADQGDSAPRRRVGAGASGGEAPARAHACGRAGGWHRGIPARLPPRGDGLDVEGGPVRDDGDLLRADAAVALDRSAAEGGDDEPALGERRLWRAHARV